MGGNTTGVILAATAGALAMLVVVGVIVLVRRRSRRQADLAEMLEAAQREAEDLRARLDAANAQLEAARPTPPPAQRKSRREAPEFLITDAGLSPATLGDGGPAETPIAVPDRLVLSATVGAPLVKVAAFSHGVRRALAPETRNRIWFEMRREVRASRKRRRQLLKEYQRTIRAEDRAKEGLA